MRLHCRVCAIMDCPHADPNHYQPRGCISCRNSPQTPANPAQIRDAERARAVRIVARDYAQGPRVIAQAIETEDV